MLQRNIVRIDLNSECACLGVGRGGERQEGEKERQREERGKEEKKICQDSHKHVSVSVCM